MKREKSDIKKKKCFRSYGQGVRGLSAVKTQSKREKERVATSFFFTGPGGACPFRLPFPTWQPGGK